MRQVRFLFHLVMCLGVVVAFGFIAFQCLSPLHHRNLARQSYEETVDHLDDATRQLRSAEQRLELLTNSPEAVEREVRSQYQMLRPNETLFLLEEEKDPLLVQPLNSTTNSNLIAATH